jgi:glycolate oxidase FAD binding subunit
LQQAAASRLWHSGLRSLGQSVTALRLENFAESVTYRTEKLKALLAPYGEIHVLDTASSLAFWDEMRQLTVLSGSSAPLWRISTAPRLGPKVVAGIARYMPVEAIYDWSGGLVWLEVPASADAGATDVRRVIALHGGHATLIRAEAPVRAAIDVFQPLEPGVERLTRRLKATFDPEGILNRGKMYASL